MKKLWNLPSSIHDNFCLVVLNFLFLNSSQYEEIDFWDIVQLILLRMRIAIIYSFVESSMVEIRFEDVSAPLIFPKTVIPLLSCAIEEIVNAFIWLVDTSKPIIAKGELFALVFKSCVGVWSIFGAFWVFNDSNWLVFRANENALFENLPNDILGFFPLWTISKEGS